MLDRKIIRLIIYLVISVSLIVLLWYLPSEKDQKTSTHKKETTEVKSPENNTKAIPFLTVQIDSAGNYKINDTIILWDELEERLVVQVKKKKNSKLFIEVDVHPKSNAEKTIDLVKLSEKLKIKIRIN
jgi:biopolymer transport protein ExbD